MLQEKACVMTSALRMLLMSRSTHCAFYHWWPHVSSDCCVGLVQSAGVGPVVSIVAIFPQQTEERKAVLSLTRNVSLHWLLREFTVIVNLLRVLAVLGLNATLKHTRSLSSSSANKLGPRFAASRHANASFIQSSSFSWLFLGLNSI